MRNNGEFCDICYDCSDQKNCETVCEKAFNYLFQHLNTMKKTKACPICGVKDGYILIPLGRDAIESVYCEKCKTSFTFMFEEDLLESMVMTEGDEKDENFIYYVKDRMCDATPFEDIAEEILNEIKYTTYNEYIKGGEL
jgi:hypothetical protein